MTFDSQIRCSPCTRTGTLLYGEISSNQAGLLRRQGRANPITPEPSSNALNGFDDASVML